LKAFFMLRDALLDGANPSCVAVADQRNHLVLEDGEIG
jgi:hypothetical protein